ncbi:hypothetical protein ACFPMF_20040 [Larkinella bovis]|uniref:Chromosome segregation protein SMC n=1 Tax=Larkinella bovis TaxID=683041 RepID=A0ABW0IFU6_9BACT
MESYNQDRRNNRKNYLLVALGILAALNLLLLYFYYQERQTNKNQQSTLIDKTQEMLITKARLDSISTQLDAKISEIQSLGGQVDSLLKVKEQLEADKRNLRNVAAFDVRKYDAKIKEYLALLNEKDKEIGQLKEENSILTSQNQTLTEENTSLKNERQALTDTVSRYSEQNRELAEKVTLGSALKAENLVVNAINRRGKESDGGEYRSRRIEKIKIAFRLATNPIAQQNEKEIYLRILDPSGSVIADNATGSGQFIVNGQEMVYTAKQTIQYDNSGQQVVFIYGRGNIPFKEGTHQIELFSEGFKIGQGDFTIK